MVPVCRLGKTVHKAVGIIPYRAQGYHDDPGSVGRKSDPMATIICADPEVAQALFEILQIDRIAKGKGKVTMMPPRSELLTTLVAARQGE